MVYRPTARVLTVLELLQSYGQLSGPDLAARLEVDVRTVRRYITTLMDMGIPIEVELGREGGYRLRPSYKLPPLMFTADEAMAITLGLLLLKQSGLALNNAAGESALGKLWRVLPPELRHQSEGLAQTDFIHGTEMLLTSAEKVQRLSQAVHTRRRIHITYGDKHGKPSAREVDPYSVVYHHEARWYVVGYCHLRQDLRAFRVDRILAVAILTKTFTPPEDFDGAEYLLDSIQSIGGRYTVMVLLEMSLTEALQVIPQGFGFLMESEIGVRFRTEVDDLEAMAQFLLCLKQPFMIETPDELRDMLKAHLEAHLKRLGKGYQSTDQD